MKKLVLVLMMALAFVTVNAKHKVADVAAKVDSALNADSLSGSDVKDLKEFKEVMKAIGESGVIEQSSKMSNESHWDVVGFAAITAPFIAGFLIVLIVLIFSHRNKKAKYELMAKAIDAGKEIPASFFEESKAKNAKSPLQSAFSMMGVGIGLFLMFWFLKGELTLSFIGAIPFMLGLGKFIAYQLEQKPTKDSDNDQKIG